MQHTSNSITSNLSVSLQKPAAAVMLMMLMIMMMMATTAVQITMFSYSESLWFQEEQGIMGDAVPDTALSEERDFLLQVVSLPDREAFEVLQGHPKHAEELRLGEVPLSRGGGRETFSHNRGAQREREVRAKKIMVSPTEGQGGRFYLQPGSVHTGGQFASPSVGHHQHLVGIDLTRSINQSINPPIAANERCSTVRKDDVKIINQSLPLYKSKWDKLKSGAGGIISLF